MNRYLLSVVCLAVAAIAAAAPTSDLQIGVGLGLGNGQFTDSEGTTVSAEDGISPQIRVGYTLHPRLVLGLEYQGWLIEDGTTEFKVRRSLQNVMLGATIYPGALSTRWSGLYARLGVGLAVAGTALTLLEINQETGLPEQVVGARLDETGLALMASMGYEFQITPVFAAGLAYSINHQEVGEMLVDHATYHAVAMTASWSFH